VERPALLAELERRAEAFDPTRQWVGQGGYRLSDAVWRGGQAVRQQIDAVLVEAIRTGEDALVTADKLEQFLDPAYAPRRNTDGRLVRGQRRGLVTRSPGRGGAGSFSARRLARTEISRAHAQATEDSAALDPFIEGLRWVLSGRHPKGDPCDDNADRDVGLGEGVYPLDALPRMPQHPMCFPAGTIVAGPRAVASTERWYVGDLVEIILTGGDYLTVTPNHPILTPAGWIAAGALHEGCYAIGSGLAERVLPAVYPDHHDGPALIQDVAVAIGRASSVPAVSVPTATEDFHGDGADAEVCVVRTDRLLGDGGDAAILEPSRQQQLGGRGSELSRLTGFGGLAKLLKRDNPAAARRVSRLRPSALFFRGDPAHGKADRVPHAAPFDPGDLQATGDAAAGDPVGGGDRLFGFPGAIPASDLLYRQIEPRRQRIVAVRRRPFVGHVYNLQTVSGWYIANGIIVHNCLCHWEKVVTEDVDAVVVALRLRYQLGMRPATPERPAPSPAGLVAAIRRVARSIAAAVGFGREAA
jgi:hypothetical protein